MKRARKRSKPDVHKTPVKRKSEAENHEDLVQDIAGIFTCSYETARDFASQCDQELEEQGAGLLFNELAHEIWSNRSASAQAHELVSALQAYIQERERHTAVLQQLEGQFTTLVAAAVDHEHLEPKETYVTLVRDRLSPAPLTK